LVDERRPLRALLDTAMGGGAASSVGVGAAGSPRAAGGGGSGAFRPNEPQPAGGRSEREPELSRAESGGSTGAATESEQ